jgi:hypothetical protein
MIFGGKINELEELHGVWAMHTPHLPPLQIAIN